MMSPGEVYISPDDFRAKNKNGEVVNAGKPGFRMERDPNGHYYFVGVRGSMKPI
jgi:hypothetical protein